MEARQALVEAALPELFQAYDAAVAAEMKTPVVFLIDCEDPIGSEIARAWEGDDAVDAAILANAEGAGADSAEKITTTLARAYSFDESRQEVPQLFPYLGDSFAQPPRDGFLIVVVSNNGAATLTAPPSARPS